MITVVASNFDTAPENGGSRILALDVWWDQGVSNWVPISTEGPTVLSTGSPSQAEVQHTVSLLSPSASYRFMYRAVNLFGYGPFSAESLIIAATKPD